MKPRTYLLIGIAIAVLVLAATTFLNRSWWMRKTHAKWNMRKWSAEGEMWAISGYDMNNPAKYPLGELITAFYKGKPGWYLVGDQPPTGQVDGSTNLG